MNRRKGFSLVDIMVVIAITAIIISIVIPQVKHAINDNKNNNQIDNTSIDLNKIENIDSDPNILESGIITGTIIAKINISYNNETGDEIKEYWFYIKRFNNSKPELVLDNQSPIWTMVNLKTFAAKEVCQRYDHNN
ncbi:hypothetical protein GW933_03955 [Candidatus Falkowbacteria bacterium]|uniref:Type II secretion system protein GspG C-terminal domain-containing protein n=1 Tax=Candidatus Buchananbacteria bacterium CG10_big_fil_rev_8_21_14_0_10_33_19 TaxID=1974525 RepID=A0A2H0W7I1_9BACT|nr:hypothetical protein [Candidatus Falkowbacteria bacterium]PIS06551.1 MAG: hypothetical protein COT80_00320 [Candidatus Buchananbacteria bacterium CG10_big_fil_rev_8_21_14_0_10_33_19]